jgi:hypothetical protein
MNFSTGLGSNLDGGQKRAVSRIRQRTRELSAGGVAPEETIRLRVMNPNFTFGSHGHLRRIGRE